jgi:hypothetical protein
MEGNGRQARLRSVAIARGRSLSPLDRSSLRFPFPLLSLFFSVCFGSSSSAFRPNPAGPTRRFLGSLQTPVLITLVHGY